MAENEKNSSIKNLEYKMDFLLKKIEEIALASKVELTWSQEIKIKDVLLSYYAEKKTFLLVFIVVIIFGGIFVISHVSEYKSEVVLLPVEKNPSNAVNGVSGGLGGLASLAGITINSAGEKTQLATEVLESRKFILEIVGKNNWAKPLLAVKNWNSEKNVINFDKSVWEKDTGWKDGRIKVINGLPSDYDIYKKFMSKLNVVQDEGTGFVKIAFTHESPYFAKSVIDQIVISINTRIKEMDAKRANENIEFLTRKLAETTVADVKVVLYGMLEDETKRIMLADAGNEYVFSVLDPAVVPDRPVGLAKSILLGGLILISAFLSFVVVVVKCTFKEVKGGEPLY